MKSKNIEKVFKYFNEPYGVKDNWVMKSRYGRFTDIESDSYSKCFDLALIEINKVFKGEN